MKTIILKLGGSIITHKSTSEEPSVNHENLKLVCDEIKKGYALKDMRLIIVHGAGNYGHPIVKRTGIHKGLSDYQSKIDMAETQVLQNELNVIVCREMIKNGLPAFPLQASGTAINSTNQDCKKIVNFDLSVVRKLCYDNIIPVLYGVPVHDEKQGCSILSGDTITAYIAKELNADLILHATNSPGIIVKGSLIDLIDDSNYSEISKHIGESKSTDITGGMKTKIKEIIDLKIPTQIFKGNERGNIHRVLLGEKVGTLINF